MALNPGECRLRRRDGAREALRRRIQTVARVVAAGVIACCTLPSLAANSTASVNGGRSGVSGLSAVEIRFEQDAADRLTVRYRAPVGVTHLKFFVNDPRLDAEVRPTVLVPADDCAVLVAGGIDLKPDARCRRGALFVVHPRVLALNAMPEAAQPDSDGGVLFYTGYYAAGADGFETNWSFIPKPGGYVVDDGRRHDRAVRFLPDPALVGKRLPPLAWLASRHAQNYVYLGQAPTRADGGLLWIADPALPLAVTEAVAAAAQAAWRAYAEAAGAKPGTDVAIVMLRARGLPQGIRNFHGDVAGGNMVRLSFIDPPERADAAQIESWRQFIAHEIGHLWNAGVYRADPAEPWLAEGDAEWVSLNAMHDAGLLSGASFVARLSGAVDRCAAVRGEVSAHQLAKDWSHGQDDPYTCGLALQLLGWVQWRASDPSSTRSALQRWSELHRRNPELDAGGFAQFFDGAENGAMHQLLFGDETPFASTYREHLGGWAGKALGFKSPTDLLRELGLMPTGAGAFRAEAPHV